MKNQQSLKNNVIENSKWVIGANIISRLISLLSTLILAKILTPDDFGIIGYGFLVVQIFALFRDMGFNSALIYQKKDIKEAASSAFWFSFGWSILLYLIIFTIAPFASNFFREPKLTNLLRLLSINIIFVSLGSVPQSLMEKDINFKKRMIPAVINQLLYGVITVVFAFLDYSYWAFVIGTIISSFFQMMISFMLHPIKIIFKINIDILRYMFSFGKNIMNLGFIYFGIRNIDDFFVGRMLGTTFLGIYQFSYRIANIPATNISNVIGKIMYPSYMKIANSDWELKNAFLKSFQYIAFIIIPATFFIILIVPDFFNLFYTNWLAAIMPIQLLAYYGAFRALGSSMGSVFYAKGKPKILIPIAITQFIILVLLLYPAIHFLGTIGVCIVLNISITYTFLSTIMQLKKILQFKLESLISVCIFPLVYSIILIIIFSAIDSMIQEISYVYFSIKLIVFPSLYIWIPFIYSANFRQAIKEFISPQKIK